MVEQKDISSPLLMEVPKSQLTVKQPMAKKQSKTTCFRNIGHISLISNDLPSFSPSENNERKLK